LGVTLFLRIAAVALALVCAGMFMGLSAAGSQSKQADALHLLANGENPYPVRLIRPAAAPLSAMARLGEHMFFDTILSTSGRMSCATCHSPSNHYGPPPDMAAVLGDPRRNEQLPRAVPSLMYLERHPPFSVGPDNDEDETTTLLQMVARSVGVVRSGKTAHNTADSGITLVPQGGLFWDGWVDTLQEQALGPLLNSREIANASADEVAAKL